MTAKSMSSTPLAHNVKDAAARIGISRSRCYELIKSGRIRSITIGGLTLVTETELQRVVAEAAKEAA